MCVVSGGAQTCNVTVTITTDSSRNAVAQMEGDVVCLQCGNVLSPATSWGGVTPTSGILDPGDAADGVAENVGGLLVLVPGTVRNGREEEYTGLFCSSTITGLISGFILYSTSEWSKA